MKKSSILTVLFLWMASCLVAQSLEKNNITNSGSYGENKFKKMPKRIYIASFNVFFQVSAFAQATTSGGRTMGGGSYDGATRTEMAVAVEGVDNADFISIVDKTYQHFIEGLKAQGYEIISADEASKAEFYREWERKEGGRVNSSQLRGYVMAVPTGYSYFIKKESASGKEKGTFIDRTPVLSGNLNNAVIAEVSFIFPTIDMDTKGGIYSKSSAVSAKIKMRLEPVAGDGTATGFAGTKVKFVAGDGPGASAEANMIHTIKKSVEFPGIFEDEKFKERTVAQNTPAYYSVVFTQDVETKVTHSAKCDTEKYKSTTESIMNQLIDYSLNELKESGN